MLLQRVNLNNMTRKRILLCNSFLLFITSSRLFYYLSLLIIIYFIMFLIFKNLDAFSSFLHKKGFSLFIWQIKLLINYYINDIVQIIKLVIRGSIYWINMSKICSKTNVCFWFIISSSFGVKLLNLQIKSYIKFTLKEKHKADTKGCLGPSRNCS